MEKEVFLEKIKSLDVFELRKIYEAIIQQASEIKLDNEARKRLAQETGVSMDTVLVWQTVADVTKYFDLSLLCEKNPEAAKSILLTTLSIISIYFPPIVFAAGIVKVVPEDVLIKIMELSLKPSPDHLVHLLAEKINEINQRRKNEYKTEETSSDNKNNLIVVCKDDMLYNQIKKLVETDDDIGDTIVGTKDGTINIIRWNEDKFAFRFAVNTINDKMLILGNYKEIEKLKQKADQKLDEYGIRYGQFDNLAYIQADRQVLRNKTDYQKFLSELETMKVPEDVKKDKTFKFNLKTGLKAAFFTPILIKDAYDDNASVIRQQLFYGAFKFYYTELAEFIEK